MKFLTALATYTSAFQMLTTDASQNPFAQTRNWYVNPSYKAELKKSIETSSGNIRTYLEGMQEEASAFWLDTKSKIRGEGTNTAQGILEDAASSGTRKLVTFIVYDVPNRDCHAKASNGEICCTYNADGSCNYDV